MPRMPRQAWSEEDLQIIRSWNARWPSPSGGFFVADAKTNDSENWGRLAAKYSPVAIAGAGRRETIRANRAGSGVSDAPDKPGGYVGRCDTCNLAFESPQLLAAHNRYTHNQKRKYTRRKSSALVTRNGHDAVPVTPVQQQMPDLAMMNTVNGITTVSVMPGPEVKKLIDIYVTLTTRI
jgi:hypothetical protein